MSENAGQIGQLVRTLAAQLRDAVTGALGLAAHDLPPTKSPRALVVEKVARNAVAELVNQARSHPQRGDLASANPAYVALAQLAGQFGIEGLALGLRNETGEISFLDLDLAPEAAAGPDGPFVTRGRNKTLWRQLKKLANILVDRNMLGPRPPIRSPEDAPDEPDFEDEGGREELSEDGLAEDGLPEEGSSGEDPSRGGLQEGGLQDEGPQDGGLQASDEADGRAESLPSG